MVFFATPEPAGTIALPFGIDDEHGVQQLNDKTHPWPLTAVAAAVLLGLWSGPSWALSLGRINVLSALGEPLRAEIDILDINADEAASLNARVASPEAFHAAGLDYSSVMPTVRTSLGRRPDGRSFIQLSSSQRINEPFVDLIIETRWSSGRILRDYTMLFDPPKTSAPAVTPPAVTAAPARPSAPLVTPLPATTPAVVATRPPTKAAAESPAAAAPGGTAVTVKAGETASHIVAAMRTPHLSLEQTLVALLRANPRAFIQNNVNLLKAGSVVTLPTEAQAAAIPTIEARQIIMAQSRDFNAYRQSLADNVPTTQVTPAERSASGKLEAHVDEAKPATTAPDKLTLSKGSVQGKSAEEQLAHAANAREAAQRAGELTRNIEELDKLASASKAQLAAPPASAPAAPPKPVVTPKVVPLPPPPPEPSFLDTLLDNPLLPVGGAGLLALLGGLLWYRRRRQTAQGDESLLKESRMQPESFFGISGASSGSSAETRDNPPTGSSMLYSPSQLDAVDDFDPVAEAAVYMAYGRDQQAEDILKDALQETPERIAIHRKLLEIYAKREDAKAFGLIAALAADLTQRSGSEWDAIRTLGLTVDPGNPLYGGGAAQSAAADEVAPTALAELSAPAFDQPAVTQHVPLMPATQTMPLETLSAAAADRSEAVDLELDLPELDLAATTTGHQALRFNDEATGEQTHEASPTLAQGLDDSLDFSLPSFTPAEPPTPTEPEAPAQPEPDKGMLEFDLDSLSLELNPPAAEQLAEDQRSPLETKLELAEEFRAIGDEESARALIEEVIAAAADEMKDKAQRALDKL